MKMTFRKVLVSALSLAMAVNLAACGASSAATDTSSTADTAASSDEDMITSAITQAVGAGSTDGVDKEETVYVFTDASGTTKNITVSNWLKNPDGDAAITDATTLTDVKNVKGDETFSASGTTLTWNADGSDIYYQGTTTKQPPVTEKITYYLNGAEVQPDALAGASGDVTIHIDYTNTEKSGDVYVPFTAVTGIALSNDDVSDVSVDHGSVASEGRNTVVVGMAFPGLQESLQSIQDSAEKNVDSLDVDQKLKDQVTDFDIPSSVEIKMKASDFKMGMCMTMVFSNLLTGSDADTTDSDITTDNNDALDKLDAKVAELTDDGTKLSDGAISASQRR